MVKSFQDNFPGISDQASKQSVLIEDDKLTVKTISVDTLTGDVTIKGDVKIYGILDAGFVRTTEIIANQRYEKQFIEFADPDGKDTVGTGLLWAGGAYKRQLVYKNNPDRFFITENLDMPKERAYMVEGEPVLTGTSLGPNVTESNLKTLGTLRELNVGGAVNVGDIIFFNPASERVSIGTDTGKNIFTVYDHHNDVELVIGGNQDGRGVIGTHSTKALDLITDNQTRITVQTNGDITLGREGTDGTVTRVYGKIGVGVKNPREQFEVAGNIRWANKLFAVGNQSPTDGNYQQGDIIWNSNPRPHAPIGWVCTVSGSPGQWKPFGTITD
jgi:hypothetical protein